ncbi:hypothetical protein [Flavobacterium sp.]|uniref:hypothetical protein n=1 Tax=Flavobacterium sp. TaxID=239 RepID=UPI00286E8F18|nr:hypothetical protein [Flavobacterium sp.]
MKSTFIKYLVLTLALILVTEITKKVLNFDKLLYTSLAEKLTSSQIESFFDLQDKWKWISYSFFPVYVLIKTILIASSVYIGVFFFSKKEISFQSVWDIILKAEFIFLLVPVFKIVWFYFFQINYTLEDFQYFYPLSGLNIIGYNGLEPWFIYPFQVLNFFEMAYVIYIATLVGKITDSTTEYGLKIVGYSYIPSMILWITVVMFFMLNNS